jgi:RNA polymerase sigma-70 factor (ECF subfamily)
MPEFEYQPGRTFRGWMRTVLINKWRDRPRRAAPEPIESGMEPQAELDNDALEEKEYRFFVVGRALQLMAKDFELATWEACWETVVCGRPVSEVAKQLGLTVNSVYLARSRVLARLRQELKGLMD